MLESESYAICSCNGRTVGSDGQRYMAVWLILRKKKHTVLEKAVVEGRMYW